MSKRGYTVKISNLDLGFDAVVISEQDARSLGVVAGSRVSIACRGRNLGALAVIDRTIEPGSIAVTEGLASKLGECSSVDIYPLDVPPSFDAFKKRLEGSRLTAAEYKMLIADIVAGFYDEAQIASFIVSQLYNKLSDDELEYLIRAMVETGEIVKFAEPVYDVHSIGGVPGNSKVPY